MSGDTQCVTLLLNSGHKVDCVDRYGWPPLLYANFKAHESCVLALMKPKPEQVFVLGELLRRARSELEKKRTVKVEMKILRQLCRPLYFEMYMFSVIVELDEFQYCRDLHICRVEHSLSCYPTPTNAFLAAAMVSPHEKKSSVLHARMGT